MTPELLKVLESKQALRRELASLPIDEKLRLLDAMRERQLAIGPDVDHRPPSHAWETYHARHVRSGEPSSPAP